MRYLPLLAYAGTIFAANWAIAAFGVVPVGFGLYAPAGVYFAGLAFSCRDLTQEALGREGALFAVTAGAVLSASLSPQLALASGLAFLASEALDMAIYTPLRRRHWLGAVAVLNTVGLVVDSVVFLTLAGFSLAFLPGQLVGKAWMTLLAVAVLWLLRGEAGVDTFFLGTHEVGWLARAGVPLCVSRRRLADRKTLPRAAAPWLLDSGGFTELSLHGAWSLTPREYAPLVRRYRDGVGLLAHAAPLDWMCEPAVLARTGLAVPEHQARTLGAFLGLREAAPELPWFPVLQGWEPDDYLRHADAYERAGVALASLPLVGVGSVCRRQHTAEAAALLWRLAARGYRLHGFGLKTQGLLRAAGALASSDSLAWSYDARRAGGRGEPPWCGSLTHKNDANCLPFALHWRRRLLDGLAAHQRTPRQLTLW